jgi:hypothetical protein
MKQGQPIDFWPREGGYTQFGTMIALKGCPLDAFYEIIDILLRPEVCFAHSLATGNLPLLDEVRVSQGAQGDARLQSDGRGHRLPHF